ncbi:Type IV pilus modification protein PilV [Halomonas sp. NYA30]
MNSQRGFSLIEALIALVVLSIGLIGVAAMQLKALQSATAGYQRSVVTLAAVDAQERLWAELAQLADGDDCSVITPQQARSPSNDSVEEQWKEWWNDDDPSNPLRSVNWENSSIELSSAIDCQFTITIEQGEGPGSIDAETFAYVFRLPKL